MAAVDSARSRATAHNVRRPKKTPAEPKPALRANARKPPPKAAAPAVPLVAGPSDPWLSATVIALIAFGNLMVYSASAVWANQHWHDDLRFLLRQAAHTIVALAAMFCAARLDYHRLRPFTYVGFVASLLLLAATALGLGHEAGGATRWLRLGPVRVQPAEVSKLAVICWLAHSLAKKSEHIRSFTIGFLPHAVGALVVMALCLKQPDFGSAVMIGLILFFMLFTAGARLGYLLGAGLASLPVLYYLVAGSEYRMRRILAFWSPGQYANSLNYQLNQSQLSFGAGGLFGVGLGDSHQKLLFLPEAHTDFISAIIGEELGLIGFAALAVAFLIVVYRGCAAALRACDEYGAYLASGITLFLGAQAFTNLAVAVGLFPTKGLVLPFISYGGSSLIVNCVAVGILLNVSRPRSPAASRVRERAGA